MKISKVTSYKDLELKIGFANIKDLKSCLITLNRDYDLNKLLDTDEMIFEIYTFQQQSMIEVEVRFDNHVILKRPFNRTMG